MRLLHLLPTLFLVFARPDAVAAQAHQNDLRALVDVCASIDADLDVPNPFGGNALVIGKLDLCLCLSAIPQFLTANVLAIAAVAIAGKPVVTAALEALINDAAGKSQCTYPAHAVPACTSSSCGFTCTDGFTTSPSSHPTSCVCKAPNTVCNGVCGHFPSCSSGKPISKREKRWEGSGSCWSKGEGWMACGVFGGAARAWECVDTQRDLESCGGCALPLTPYTPMGTDCTAIPGIADVSCQSGSCVVHRCLPGYVKAPNGSECIRKHSGSKHHVAIEEWDEEDMRAMRYGLEHVPLDH